MILYLQFLKKSKMKKTTITFLMSALLLVGGIKAQSIQEGINHLHADRFKSAIAVFDKLLATNPNNIEAIYWKGQVYLDDDNNAAAADLYSKALQSTNNAPLIQVGMGHVDLLEKRTNEARQKFESAITMTRTKKGDDPGILLAIGRANVDAKLGDFHYAIEKLEAAAQKDPRNPEIYLELGNAYRKARPGEGGGKAYENYKKAIEVKPDFAAASIRLSKIFETQRNWELVLQYLNDAIKQDPKFAPAYYELFYYYFFIRMQYPEAEAQIQKYIANMDQDVQNDFLYAQLCWAKKDFTCAIAKSNTVIAAMGSRTKPKVYKLLADTYFQLGDYVNSKKYSDEYFAKEKPEEVNSFDYKLKADILSKLGAPCEELYGLYLQGATMDTVLQSRIDYLTVVADSFKARKCPKQEADMRMVVYNMRPKPNPSSLVNIGITYSQAGEYAKADSLIAAYTAAFPDSIYGYYWRYRVSFSIDTTLKVEPYATNYVENAKKTLELALANKIRFKTQGIGASLGLVGYYNNVKADRTTALMYALKGLEIDSSHAQLKSIRDILQKPAGKQPSPRGNSTPAKSDGKTPATKPAATKTTTGKPVIKK
jgi:tetratricopeptide (TPR) repeat protein